MARNKKIKQTKIITNTTTPISVRANFPESRDTHRECGRRRTRSAQRRARRGTSSVEPVTARGFMLVAGGCFLVPVINETWQVNKGKGNMRGKKSTNLEAKKSRLYGLIFLAMPYSLRSNSWRRHVLFILRDPNDK